jgi:hypothetical protein
MKLFIPCLYVTYDFIGAWNYLYHAHLLHTTLLVHEIIHTLLICYIRLYWYMKLVIPCLYVTYDFIGTWNYLCHAYLLHTTLLVHEIIYTMLICYIRLYWYMQVFIPCSSVTTHDINISQLYKNKDKLNVPIKSYVTDHVPIKSYLTDHVPRKSYVTDENGIINCMYQ